MDHGASQSTGAAAPTVDERMASLAQGMISDSQEDPNAWEQEQEAPEGEATEEAQPPQEQETPAEEATEEPLEEVEFEGKQYKVPVEIKRGLLREADYTRKTQKLAETFKSVSATHEQVVQQAQVIEQLAPHIGQFKLIEGQIQALQREMTPELEANDPMRFGSLGTRLTLLLNQRGEMAQRLNHARDQIIQGLDQAKQQMIRARMESEMPVLEAAVKDFNPEKHGKEVRDYLRKSGLSQEAQSFIEFSPAAIALVWKARAYDQLQADKTTAQKKVEKLPPVAKPGQRTSSAEGDVDLKKLRDLNRKTGGKDPDVRRALLAKQLFGR